MTFLEIIRKEPGGQQRKLLFMGVVAGLSNASILAIIVSASQSISKQQSSLLMVALFALAIVIYALSQRLVFALSVNMFESIVETWRNRITDKIRRSDLITLEKLGKTAIYSRLTQGTSTVSQSTSLIVAGYQGAVIVLFSLVYIAMLSVLALLLCAGLIITGVWMYLRRQEDAVSMLQETSRIEVEYVTMMNHLLDGFVEHKLNRDRSEDLAQETKSVAARSKALKVKVMDLLITNQVFSQYFMYIIMGVIVFILPRLAPTYHQAINQISTTLLFLIGPLGSVVSAFPAFTRVEMALRDIQELEQQLDEHFAEPTGKIKRTEPKFHKFAELELRRVDFSYRDKSERVVFSVGPIDLRIKAGETVFIVGGNGSGKSTFLKLMVGLYKPDGGTIRMNGVVVSESLQQPYREMFSGVFSDFHLFERLYGIKGVKTATVKRLIKEMQLEAKTTYEKGRFSNVDLSSGQRKRLALIVSLLEDRQIFVLDEWAAEQDPVFRNYFYTHILAALKKRSKTIVAITHDDAYFHLADRVLKLDYGRIVETDLGSKAPAPGPVAGEEPESGGGERPPKPSA